MVIVAAVFFYGYSLCSQVLEKIEAVGSMCMHMHVYMRMHTCTHANVHTCTRAHMHM